MTFSQVLSRRELAKIERRATIVEIATRSFLERGYAATTMSTVADELGGSKATLWAYFCSKEELFSAVIDRLIGDFASKLEDVLIGKLFSRTTLRSFCLRFIYCLLNEDSARLFRMVMGEGERFPELGEVLYTRGVNKMICRANLFFETRFEPAEAAALARVTIAAVVGYRSHLLMRATDISGEEIERWVDDLILSLRLPEEPHG